MKIFDVPSYDGEMMYLYLWADVKGSPKGVVQILHGMAEHMGRYQEVAEKLNANGYIAIGGDLRGHGKTAGEVTNVGRAGTGDIFAKTVKDATFIMTYTKKIYKDLPYFVLGHSYGSMLLQRFMEYNSRAISGAILVGSACLKGSMDVFMGRVLCKFAKKDKPANIIKKMSFDKYNKQFPGEIWITRDKDIQASYNEDPFCGSVFTFGFYRSFFRGVANIYKKNELDKIANHLPILILSGEKDGYSKNSKLANNLYDLYTKKMGLDKVEKKIYSDARHEVLNETNREEVYSDVVAFLDKNI